MTRQKSSIDNSRGLSRREFIKLAAMTGLLAGCSTGSPAVVVPTSEPTTPPRPTDSPVSTATPTDTPLPTNTSVPTSTPLPTNTSVPTNTPLPTNTSAPTATLPPPTPTISVVDNTAEITKFYPNVPSKVVYARHAGVWDGDTLSVDVINQILDASITNLTGLNDAIEAWAALFSPAERIAIKVNTIRDSSYWTHLSLVDVVTDKLQAIGAAPEQIVIFDRFTSELENAAFQINQDGAGVRCYGQDGNYASGYTIMEQNIGLSSILLECDALINIPLLKQHSITGVSFAMKNHYGTFDQPGRFHGQRAATAIPQLNALEPIKDRTRLIIGDIFDVVQSGWYHSTPGEAILMSFDPVAHDAVGLQIYNDTMMAAGNDRAVAAATRLADGWLLKGAEMGLGTNNFDNIDVVEVNLA